MTVADLIDYLSQLEPQTFVVLTADDIDEPCEFVALDSIFAEASS